MILLVFAHRGEAQSFFDQWEFKPVDFIFSGLFKSRDYYLLLTGEGPREASEKTVATLGLIHRDISKIINIGVAGSLSAKLKLHDLVWVRTSFADHAEKLEFKSFTSSHHSHVDCMTAWTRITSKERKQELSSFADLVDRELWSIMSAGQLFKKDVFSLKIISDESDSSDICKLVKEDAPLLSRKLLEAFLEYQEFSKEFVYKEENTDFIDYFLGHDYLYFTTSQKRKLEGLLKGFKIKQNLSKDELIVLTNEIINEHKENRSAKDIAKILLTTLSEKLNPLKTLINQKLAEALKPLHDSGINATIDTELEKEFININYQIQSERDLRKLILALEYFKFSNFKDIFDGKFDYDV